MGKTKKQKSVQSPRVPLDQEIADVKFAKPKNRDRLKIRFRKNEDEQFVDSDLSRKILSAAREQQRELESEFPTLEESMKAARPTKLDMDDSDDEDFDIRSQPDVDADAFYGNISINKEDEEAIEKFMSKNPGPRRTLADIIMDKITEKQTDLETRFSDSGTLQIQDIDSNLQHFYEDVGNVLKRYRSGKLPKAFKFIPTMRNWEQILYITDPPSWTAAAMYQGTRIFASNLTERLAQKFFNLVLLPRIRDDLAEYKRLNFHLYQALKKALYKPAAFMKGLLLPLLESGTCTLREAIIVGSIVAKNSIPILHGSAAIIKIADMEYTGANSIMLRILLDKKYALPYRVVDAVVHHFLRFETDTRELPVLWHQAFLTFVQRYKADISSDQRDYLWELLQKKSHPTITPEIRRELQHAKCRDLETTEPAMQTD